MGHRNSEKIQAQEHRAPRMSKRAKNKQIQRKYEMSSKVRAAERKGEKLTPELAAFKQRHKGAGHHLKKRGR